jgi:general secretion pathway protein A
VDSAETRRSLADDFLTSLLELDRGLEAAADVGVSASPLTSSVRPTPPREAPARRPLLDLFPPRPSRTEAPPRFVGDTPALDGASKGPARATPAPAGAPFKYETFYGLAENPFADAVDLRFLYHSAALDRSADELCSALRRRDRLVVVTGRTGVGKTTLCRYMVEELDRRTLVSFVGGPVASVADLLKTILVDYGVIPRTDVARHRFAASSRVELATTLRNFLGSLGFLQASAVVIVDEAQQIPVEALGDFASVIEEMRADELLQFVLVGGERFARTLERRELGRLHRHVAARIEVGPLTAGEISDYVRHRVEVAGARARLEFTDRALNSIFRLSRGIPRDANLVCARAVAHGYEEAASVIDDELVQKAAQALEIKRPAVRAARALIPAFILAALAILGGGSAVWLFQDRVDAIMHRLAPLAPVSPAPALPQDSSLDSPDPPARPEPSSPVWIGR